MNAGESVLKGFKIYRQTSELKNLVDYNRTDLYKICLFTGKGKIRFNEKEIAIDGHILFFGTPQVLHGLDWTTVDYQAYSCIFTKDFMQGTKLMTKLEEEFLFSNNEAPLFSLNELQWIQLKTIFKEMLYEQEHQYRYRSELIQNYLKLIVLEAMKPKAFVGIFYQKIYNTKIV
ncbi:hypothetical protein HZP44_14875 [Elizabethkingia anophelis]|nr:hypothetical protein [Elizabethkingia anophelis]MCT4209642.1 hypothetical protein [Elizabethkingia anophelis]MDV4102702.1 hypothetical protein [Elizabethkingia anophelis]